MKCPHVVICSVLGPQLVVLLGNFKRWGLVRINKLLGHAFEGYSRSLVTSPLSPSLPPYLSPSLPPPLHLPFPLLLLTHSTVSHLPWSKRPPPPHSPSTHCCDNNEILQIYEPKYIFLPFNAVLLGVATLTINNLGRKGFISADDSQVTFH